MPSNKRIAFWVSEKKLQKLNWQELETISKKFGFEVFKLSLKKSLESQGPFCVLVHKMTDIIASANMGDIRCGNLIQEVENYISQNPSLVVIDPIANVRKLIDRCNCYSIIHSTNLSTYNVFTPNFCTLRTGDKESLKQQLKMAKVTYPFICKPMLGHGSKKAHEMSIIFNEKYLTGIKTPCVAQSFINHDAVLFKIYIAGDKHYYVERPSLKNFKASERETIYFDTSDVSKSDSKSRLCVLDPEDILTEKPKPDEEIIAIIAATLTKAFGMDLLGADVVIEKSTRKYAIIDVNAYPGYEGFPNFFDCLLECITKKISSDFT
ncbi:inositol-tetrakisphosphate 1-kinase isoform X1 [Diabrotica virgifera virgifera]|uniref:Inositol-tetrakisphosphate 1-kinase n=1 Tax=Diabrotica virgifera virgifera TaxID=50390 RepID=A0A6P7FDY4_DIAVI|nr:inositol-tetrakisphosphate 1-kinase isoform X1 [Diabrotica virgifera virgifera]